MLHWTHNTLLVNVLVDSGTEDNFITFNLVTQANIPTHQLANPKEVFAINGKQLSSISHRPDPITLFLSGNHHKTIFHFFMPVSGCSRVSLAQDT